MNHGESVERRRAPRFRSDVAVVAWDRVFSVQGRGIDLSTTGVLVDWGKPAARDAMRFVLGLELHLPERLDALRAVARPVWSFANQQAFRFVALSDVDRLDLAEHLDALRLRGSQLC
jgi:cation transport ATPase